MASGSLPQYSYKGVTYTFVDTPLQSLEDLKCSICLELVSDPVQTSCGHLFCGKCLKGIRQCPIDRESFTTTPDHFNKRRLRSFKVKCPKSVKGCDWQGDLGDAEKHTEEKCNYQEVKCPKGCDKNMQRQDLSDHLQINCPLRDYQCPHCRHQGTFESVTTSHYTICEDFPLTCPAGCHVCIHRKNMATHLQQSCPMEFVECEYKMLGCSALVKRNAIDEHNADVKYHLKMAMKAQVKMFSCLQSAFSAAFQTVPDVSSLPLSFRPWLQTTPTCYPIPPWVIKMEGFQGKKENQEVWYSDPVYSHFGGYKMSLRVDANGTADGKGTHVSAFISTMKGDNDDNLKWPFKGTIKVSLLNQLEDGQHLTKIPWTPNRKCDRVRGVRAESTDTWGFGCFTTHEDLSQKSRQFLKDDTLFFRVDCIELSSEMMAN